MTTLRTSADWDGTLESAFSEDEVEMATRLVSSLRGLLDAVATMRPDTRTMLRLTARFEGLRRLVRPLAAEETERVVGRIGELPVRGRAALPELTVDCVEPGRMSGTVVFGPWFLGAAGAAHGGAISMMFDDLLGRTSEPVSAPDLNRTAYLQVHFRHIAPIGVELRAHAWIERVEGRKVYVRGELVQGETVCAEAEALLLRLLPEQGAGKVALS